MKLPQIVSPSVPVIVALPGSSTIPAPPKPVMLRPSIVQPGAATTRPSALVLLISEPSSWMRIVAMSVSWSSKTSNPGNCDESLVCVPGWL